MMSDQKIISNPEAVKNILVVRNDRFGEFLLNIPVMRALKETFVNARVTAVVNPAIRDLALCVPFIDDIVLWKPGKHPFVEKINLIRQLRNKRFDCSLVLNPSKDFHLFTFWAGIPVRVGYSRKWGKVLLTHYIRDEKHLGLKHEVEYNLDLVRLIGASTKNVSLELIVPHEDVISKFNFTFSKPFVLVHPWTSDPVKQWPIENFRELVKRISGTYDVSVVIIGGEEEKEKSIRYFSGFSQNVLNLTGKTTFPELLTLVKKSAVLISADSGPVHLAACAGVPVVALFRNDLPGKTANRWGPWGNGHCVIEKPGMDTIMVEEVYEAVNPFLHADRA